MGVLLYYQKTNFPCSDQLPWLSGGSRKSMGVTEVIRRLINGIGKSKFFLILTLVGKQIPKRDSDNIFRYVELSGGKLHYKNVIWNG